ncbi:PEP-CTERM sorting domain-containing protein [Isosphaeraceae bacterium EP7]
MVLARMPIAAAALLLAAMAGTPARGESFSGTIEGQVSIDVSYAGSVEIDPSEYQSYSYVGKGSLSFSFELQLPVNPDFGSFAYNFSFSIAEVGLSPTPDALILAYDGSAYGSVGNYVGGSSNFESKGFHQDYSVSLADKSGLFFGTGSTVPGMTASASAYVSNDVGPISGTIIRQIRASFTGSVAPAPVPVPEPSGLVLMGIAGLCGLVATAKHHRRALA